jgi:hypothetical protein
LERPPTPTPELVNYHRKRARNPGVEQMEQKEHTEDIEVWKGLQYLRLTPEPRTTHYCNPGDGAGLPFQPA